MNCPICKSQLDPERVCHSTHCLYFGAEVPVSKEETIECPECCGGGMVAKLFPSGHTEVKCERCYGEGVIDNKDCN